MRNFLTIRVESWLGSVFIVALGAFFVGLLLIAVKNFDSDNEILNSSSTRIRTIAGSERALIDKWLERNSISLSVEDVGYRYIIRQFPSKPWATE